jgi:hypothetical protein
MCEQLKVLHFNLRMPLKFFVFCGALLQRWSYNVLVTWKSIIKLVYLNKLLTLRTSGLHYVEETHFFFVFVWVWLLFVMFEALIYS